MKNPKIIILTLLACGGMTTACVVYLLPHDSRSNSTQTGIADGWHDESNYGSMEIKLGSNEVSTKRAADGLFFAVRTLDVSDGATDLDHAESSVAAQARDRASGVGGLRREELMAEANRIMSDLYRAGVLTRPVCFACAFADTSPNTDKATIILERFRGMHQKHLALVKRMLTSADQDSLTIRGWSQIRFDLAKLQKMAADLRNETALAAR